MCTSAAENVRTLPSQLTKINCLDNCEIFCLDKRIRFQAGSMVITLLPALTVKILGLLLTMDVAKDGSIIGMLRVDDVHVMFDITLGMNSLYP